MHKSLFFISFLGIILVQITISAQDHKLTQITFSDSTHDGYPYWMPDGDYIIYSAGSDETVITMKIAAKGGSPEPVTDVFAHHAQCSPDGAYIAFDGYMGSMIQLVSTNGGSPIKIIPDSHPIIHSGYPCWSPDSRQIAFMSEGDLWTLDLATDVFTLVGQMDGKLILPHCWHPDGHSLFADVRDTLNRRETDIWEIPLSGEPEQITALGGYQVKPSISPDGSMIAFASDHGGNADLWIMPAQGSEPVQITFYPEEEGNPGYDIEPSWSPDRIKIVFSSKRTGYWAIWIIEPDLESVKNQIKQ